MLSRKTTLKTYSHLARRQQIPSAYEIGSSELLPYLRSKKFELDLPIVDWYRVHQQRSPLRCEDWDGFSDPRALTYSEYAAQRTVSEQFVDRIFSIIEETRSDEELNRSWLDVLDSVLAPMRYPYHAFQMIAAYIGQMAPSSKIAICCTFQAADEMRKIQRIAYRIGQIRQLHSGFADNARRIWEQDPIWQEIRKLSESLLVTYDWAEALVVLNTMIKPALEPVFMVDFPGLAKSKGDEHLAAVFSSLHDNSAWHAEWSEALMGHAIAAYPDNAEVIASWNAKWQPLVDSAAEQFHEMLCRMKA
jgi:toluene monooxygenase system protein E